MEGDEADFRRSGSGGSGPNYCIKEETNNLQYCLMGKVLTNKLVNIEAFRSMMKNMWKVQKNTITDYVGDNLLMIRFLNQIEMRRVIYSGPWLFDKSLVLLEVPQNIDQSGHLELKSATFFIHLYNLPLICMNRSTLLATGQGRAASRRCSGC